MKACERFYGAIREVTNRGMVSVTDELALHLDECRQCRSRFDLGKVEIPKHGFEILDEAARRKIVIALGAARVRAPRKRLWAAGLTAAAATIFIAIGAANLVRERSAAERVADAFVEDHIRYLHHPDRTGGGGQAALERYLESYVDFPVELAIPPQSRLTGARRCFVLGRRTALIFYETPRGPASFFVVPADGLKPPGRGCPGAGEFACAASRGYRLVSWESAGLLHVLVGSREQPLLEMARACRLTSMSPAG